jgi:uncharacterized protein (DUF1810 family)
MIHSYDLQRFVAAQDAGGTYERAVEELRHGRKATHWMWFVFPQMAGLGSSAMSERYAISSLPEAVSYYRHPVLGARLIECVSVLLGLTDRTAVEIFGSVDSQKLQSSMTLFMRAAPEDPQFAHVLELYFGGEVDPATDQLIQF